MEQSEIVFSKARNGQNTCSLNNKFFHSSYNPENEAKQFTENLSLDFEPSCIIILEPALSYCASFLRKRFPAIKLIAIRLSKSFTDSDKEWDQVIYFEKQNFGTKLFNKLGEDALLAAGIFNWPGSKNIYESLLDSVWEEIRQAVITSRNVLYTRQYFSKRWLINSVRFASGIKNICIVKPFCQDILITASGPSLKTSIPYIKKNRDSFYLIAVSSSLSPLLHNSIIPDMVLSTDGGYWAKKHLECSFTHKDELKNTVFAISDEGAVPSDILKTFKIMPLCYPESVGEKLFTRISLPFVYAERNGTVSGTACKLALSLTSGTVYFCGLDLCPANGYQHTVPNLLENRSMNFDCRIKSKETRLSASRFNSAQSLTVYRNWFSAQPPVTFKRLKRLSDNYKYAYSLEPAVLDLSWNEFFCNNMSKKVDNSHINQWKSELFCTETVEEIIQLPEFQKELFPVEALMLKRAVSVNDKNIIENKLKILQKELMDKIRRVMNG